MTIVPRAGPFSASSALATTSWYQRGKSSDRGVNTLLGIATPRVASAVVPGPRVRFAPAPTGFLHVGSARAALFNCLYARHPGGTFVLRIEDTDPARSPDDLVAGIERTLHWLGLDWDEGPVRQSTRASFYQAAADRLEAEGRAYWCD